MAALFVIVCVSLRREFDHDEFEALKSAWKILQGERIYVDFFQHHHPFFYFLLTPLLLLFGEGLNVVIGARLLTLVFLLGILTLTYAIARPVYGRPTALLASLFLTLTPLFVTSAIEVRPDVPQVFFGLLSVYLLHRFFDTASPIRLVASGFALGIAFLFLQKALLLALIVGLLIAGRIRRNEMSVRELAVFAAALVALPLAYAGYTWLRGDWSAYVFFNFEFNAAGARHSREHLSMLAKHVRTFNPLVMLGFLVGLFAIRKTATHREMVILAVGLGALALLNGVHFTQYYLMALPFVIMVAAHGFVQTLGTDRRIALIALVLVAALPLEAYVRAIRDGNEAQLARIEYVRKISQADDYVLDGDIRFNLFRKDLDFFWFGLLPGYSLDKYRTFRPYPYDIYALIEHHRPIVISSLTIPNMDDPRIQNHYVRSPAFEDLYVRRAH